MTKEERRRLSQFEARVRQLLLQYKTLQDENTRLNDTIVQKDEAIKTLQTDLDQCQQKYETLKTAKMMTITDGDIHAARRRITRLVREVNKCISLLKTEGIENATQE